MSKQDITVPDFILEIREEDSKKPFCSDEEFPNVDMRIEEWPSCVGKTRVAVYRPRNSGEILPCFFFIHGGGWTTRNLQFLDDFCRLCADNLGISVISPEYMLAPESSFPQMPQECLDCVDYARAHSAALKIDPQRMAIGGDSAGAQLTTSLCVRLAQEGKSYFRAQLLYYGSYDLTGSTPPPPGLDASAITDGNEKVFRPPEFGIFCRQAFVGDHDPHDPRISAIFAPPDILQKQPPALIISCAKDSLCTQSDRYARLLAEHGVEVSYKLYLDGVHAILSRKTEGYQDLLALTYRYLGAALGC